MNIRDISLRKKFTFFGSIVVVVSILVTAFACLWQVRSDMLRQVNTVLDSKIKVFWELLLSKDGGLSNSGQSLAERIKATNIHIEQELMLIGFYGLNNDTLIVDKMKELSGGVASIYMKDTTISTNMVNKDGVRTKGAKITGEAYERVVKNGKPFRGSENFFGIPYFVAYDPIYSKDGQAIGALFVGVPKSDYFATFNRIMMVICGISIILIFIVSTFIYTYVKRAIGPLKYLVKSAHKLAEGDLSMEIRVERKDEVGQLLGAMKNMIEKWRGVVNNVKAASDVFSLKGEDLSTNAGQMSRRASDQSMRSTQVASSAEEMARTVMDIAKNINTIATATTKTVGVAKEGEAIVHRSITEVKEIAKTVEESAKLIKSLGERSRHIGDIINVIDEIADQTNLLALNAAIEAARAGEQGRGFAVVADEVRKLAEKTAGATSEISQMISAIQDEMTGTVNAMKNVADNVDVGVTLSAQAGDALKVIVEKADELELMVQQIASATEQMAATSEAITKDIEQIAIISRETQTSSEVTNQTASELLTLSRELQKTVSGFTVSAGQ